MGGGCCTLRTPHEPPYAPSPTPWESESASDESLRVRNVLDPSLMEHLILETLSTSVTRLDSGDEIPTCVKRLYIISDKEDGWIQMIHSVVNLIPLENPFGPTAMAMLLEHCPLPSKDLVIKLTQLFKLSAERPTDSSQNVRVERNICIVLGLLAEKLIGPNSTAILTEDVLEYLIANLDPLYDPRIVLFALIALEKFALTTENRLTIKSHLEQLNTHPLLILEKFSESHNHLQRQIGFCAIWALDNHFVVEGRPLYYETVDMSEINALLNCWDASDYLQISSNGLEARNDAYSFESVRCTFQVMSGCWYYEVYITTPGVMQIGWATKASYFFNDDGFGIGDDVNSIGYDGCRRLIWYDAQPTTVVHVPAWRAGDILGCLLDVEKKELIFSLNGKRVLPFRKIFENIRHGFHAAASLMAYQQCWFNFGSERFRYPPTDREYCAFNDYGSLTEEQKKIIPKRIYLETLRDSDSNENACSICFDELACCVLVPCGHSGFCSLCTSMLRECPMCRAEIMNVKKQVE